MAQVKKYTVEKAINNAGIVLKNKGIREICINATRKYSSDDLLTLDELNDLVEKIIDDSIFYS